MGRETERGALFLNLQSGIDNSGVVNPGESHVVVPIFPRRRRHLALDGASNGPNGWASCRTAPGNVGSGANDLQLLCAGADRRQRTSAEVGRKCPALDLSNGGTRM